MKSRSGSSTISFPNTFETKSRLDFVTKSGSLGTPLCCSTWPSPPSSSVSFDCNKTTRLNAERALEEEDLLKLSRPLGLDAHWSLTCKELDTISLSLSLSLSRLSRLSSVFLFLRRLMTARFRYFLIRFLQILSRSQKYPNVQVACQNLVIRIPKTLKKKTKKGRREREKTRERERERRERRESGKERERDRDHVAARITTFAHSARATRLALCFGKLKPRQHSSGRIRFSCWW